MPSREFYSVCTLTSQHRERVLVSLYFVSLCAGMFMWGYTYMGMCEHKEVRGQLWYHPLGADYLGFEG